MMLMMIRLPEGGVGEHQLEGAAESKHHGLIINYHHHDEMIVIIPIVIKNGDHGYDDHYQ